MDYRGILDDVRYTKTQRYFLLNYGFLGSKIYDESVQNFS
jgi:hypothetical protein